MPPRCDDFCAPSSKIVSMSTSAFTEQSREIVRIIFKMIIYISVAAHWVAAFLCPCPRILQLPTQSHPQHHASCVDKAKTLRSLRRNDYPYCAVTSTNFRRSESCAKPRRSTPWMRRCFAWWHHSQCEAHSRNRTCEAFKQIMFSGLFHEFGVNGEFIQAQNSCGWIIAKVAVFK